MVIRYSFQNFSKLLCLHFGTWDRSKEWSVVMPQGEDIMVSKTTFK